MLHFLISNWSVPAIAFVASVLFIIWKMCGGALLFKPKKKDDGTTTVLKLIFGMGWMIGSMFVCMWVAFGSAVWLLVDLVDMAFGAR